MQCHHSKDNIIITNESVILLNEINTIILTFCIKNFIEQIFLFRVCYYNKLDTKLIFLRILNCKRLLFFSSNGIFKIQDKELSIILSHLTIYNLYKVYLENVATNLVIISQRAMTANISKSAANFLIWHCRFTHLNKIFIKKFDKITSGMVVIPFDNKLFFCSICVKVKITK